MGSTPFRVNCGDISPTIMMDGHFEEVGFSMAGLCCGVRLLSLRISPNQSHKGWEREKVGSVIILFGWWPMKLDCIRQLSFFSSLDPIWKNGNKGTHFNLLRTQFFMDGTDPWSTRFLHAQLPLSKYPLVSIWHWLEYQSHLILSL